MMQGPDRVLSSPSNPRAIAFAPDGRTLTAACADGQIRVWDLTTGKLVRTTARPAGGGPAGLLDANHYADLGPNHTVRIWDLTAEAAKSLYGHASRPEAVASGGPWIATASERERSVRLWDAATGEPRRIMADGIGGAATLVFSPDGGLLVSANYDTDIRVWRTGSGELIRKIEDQAGAMFAASFTPDGKHLVMGGLDENIYLYDAQNWRLARTLKGHGETIAALAISPDGRLLVTGGFDTTTTQNPVKVVFWDLAAGRILRSAAAPHAVVSLAFSPDSKWVAVTAREKEITLWKSPA